MNSTKILAIGDKPDNLAALTAVIDTYLPGYVLISSTSGIKGIELAIEEQPEVIVIDIIMPGMDGFEVCSKLKEITVTANIPVILLTAMKSESDHIIKGLESGADSFLSKPLDPPELAAQLRVALRIKKSEDSLRFHQKELEDLVNERTKKLLKANKELAQENMVRRKAEELLRKSESNLRELSMHLEDVREKERTRLARELHDELGQLITALKMELAQLKNKLAENDYFLKEKIESLLGLTDKAFKAIRDISSRLRSELLDNLGLVAAIHTIIDDFQSRTQIKCTLNINTAMEDCTSISSSSLFRIVQESLTNIARHAQATEVKLDITCDEDSILLLIADNGIGISEDKLKGEKSFGILGMRERAIAMGGTLELSGITGKGTTIMARFPAR